MSYPITLAGGWSKLAEEVDDELARARRKFPRTTLLTTALSEEYGEAIRAVLELRSAIKKAERDDYPSDERFYDVAARKAMHRENIAARRAELRKELVQTMAMCVRLELEGDPAHDVEGAGQ